MGVSASSFRWTGKQFSEGIQRTIARLRTFKASVAKKHLRKAANEASKVHLKALKAITPAKHKDWGSGLWKKSLGRKVKVFAKYGGSVVVWWAVGPRSAHFAMVPQKYKWFRYKGPHDKPAPGKYAMKRRTYRENKRGWEPGRVYRIPITSKTPQKFAVKKVWPVKYSHLLERKRKLISRANDQAKAAIDNVLTDTLTQAMASI